MRVVCCTVALKTPYGTFIRYLRTTSLSSSPSVRGTLISHCVGACGKNRKETGCYERGNWLVEEGNSCHSLADLARLEL